MNNRAELRYNYTKGAPLFHPPPYDGECLTNAYCGPI